MVDAARTYSSQEQLYSEIFTLNEILILITDIICLYFCNI